MKVYYFGNIDNDKDNKVFPIVENLKRYVNASKFYIQIEFIYVDLNKDVPFNNKENIYIIDTVQGVDNIEIIQDKDMDSIALSSLTSVHDFDLGFQIKYLRKLNKIGKIKILAVPQELKLNKTNYLRIQEIFKKFVAQDIQGS